MTETSDTAPSFEADNPTAKQAAELLGVDPSRVRQWVKDGRLQQVEGSDPLRVTLDSVLRLREHRQDNPQTPPPPRLSRRDRSDLEADLQRALAEKQAAEERAVKAEADRDADRRELRALERAAGRSEVLEEVVADLKAERDKLSAQLEQEKQARIEAEARTRRRWRKR